MRFGSRAVPATLSLVLLASTVARPSAAHAGEPRSHQAPSIALPLVAGAVLLGGLALQLDVAFELGDRNPDCVRLDGGCFWLGVGASTATLLGGAGLALTSWRYGEAAGERDRAAGAVADVSGRKFLGLVLAGLAVATNVGASIYSGIATAVNCVDDGTRDYACASRTAYVPTLVSLAATPALVAGAVLASHAFGYEREARRGAPQTSVAPWAVRGGAGLALVGRF